MSGFPPGASTTQVDPIVLAISSYGAKGDSKIGQTGTTTNNSAVLTDANASFSQADVGKVICLCTNSRLGTDLTTTIISVQSATQITMGANTLSGCYL